MRLRDRAKWIGEQLDLLYPQVPIPLSHSDPYTLLVAVLLSAQCTDERVNKVTPALFALADNPAAMAELDVQQILDVVRPCGLGPQKASAISRLSALLCERHGGEVPCDFAALEELPGVGHKTASVVMNQAFGQPAFPVDTHIHRLARRWRLSNGSSVNRTERDLKALFAQDEWGRRHLQFIFYGREYCTARGCDGSLCPFCRHLNTAGRGEKSGAKE